MNGRHSSLPTRLQDRNTTSPAAGQRKSAAAKKGNQNARKHGFYSGTLKPPQWDEYWHVVTSERLDPQIAFIRIKLRAVLRRHPVIIAPSPRPRPARQNSTEVSPSLMYEAVAPT